LAIQKLSENFFLSEILAEMQNLGLVVEKPHFGEIKGANFNF